MSLLASVNEASRGNVYWAGTSGGGLPVANVLPELPAVTLSLGLTTVVSYPTFTIPRTGTYAVTANFESQYVGSSIPAVVNGDYVRILLDGGTSTGAPGQTIEGSFSLEPIIRTGLAFFVLSGICKFNVSDTVDLTLDVYTNASVRVGSPNTSVQFLSATS